MKKEYIKPETEIIVVRERSSILMGSTDESFAKETIFDSCVGEEAAETYGWDTHQSSIWDD